MHAYSTACILNQNVLYVSNTHMCLSPPPPHTHTLSIQSELFQQLSDDLQALRDTIVTITIDTNEKVIISLLFTLC